MAFLEKNGTRWVLAGSLEASEEKEEPFLTEAGGANGSLVRRVMARTGSYEFKGIKGQWDSRQSVGKNTSPRDPLLAHSLARRWTDGVWFIKGKCA